MQLIRTNAAAAQGRLVSVVTSAHLPCGLVEVTWYPLHSSTVCYNSHIELRTDLLSL